MLYLESFTHRVTLAEIISRWMVNQAQPGDVRQIKKIVNFNSYMSRVWVDALVRQLLRQLHGSEAPQIIARTKGELKDFVVDHPTYSNARIAEMCDRYRRFPEDFYRETPLDGSYYVLNHDGPPRFVACSRIKHFRRIAEKGSRRIVDFMLSRIRINADALAEERARSMGIAKNQLVSSPEQMADEFRHAERRVIKSIKRGTIQAGLPVLAIPDVVGAKLIVEDADYPRLLAALKATGVCEVLEEERHTGNYKAVNLRIAYTVPRDLLAAFPPSGPYRRVLEFRGFDPATLRNEYLEFVEQGDDRVLVEIIVANFQEYLESELGRCMHEERVLSQRAHPDYQGHLSTNVRHLMDYILGLCLGPDIPEITDVPLKLWVKYMPDTIEHLMRACYLPDDLFFDAVLEVPVAEA